MVGLFINTLPMRVRVSYQAELADWLQALQSQQVEMSQYEYSPLIQVQGWSEVPRGLPLFTSIFAFENYPIDNSLLKPSSNIKIEYVQSVEQTNYPLTVLTIRG